MSDPRPRPPFLPLPRVFHNERELKPKREEDIRLVSNGESYGIQHRSRFLFWSWWSKPIHTGLTLEVAQEHIRRVRAEIRELRKKRRERWYPITVIDGTTFQPVDDPNGPPPTPPPWQDSGRQQGEL